MSQAFPRETALTTLVLMVLSGAAVAPGLVRAQEGVAGAPPVFSSPKKPPPPASAEDSPQDEDATKQGNQIRVISNLVTAPVTVLDSSGEFVYDLQKEDFQVLDNGVPQQIQDFEIELRSLAVVIVVQTNH